MQFLFINRTIHRCMLLLLLLLFFLFNYPFLRFLYYFDFSHLKVDLFDIDGFFSAVVVTVVVIVALGFCYSVYYDCVSVCPFIHNLCFRFFLHCFYCSPNVVHPSSLALIKKWVLMNRTDWKNTNNN